MTLQYLKIGDLCNVSSSKRVFARQYVEDGIPFYRQKEIVDKKKGNPLENLIYISESIYNDFKEKFGVPLNGDLLITAVGTFGIPYIVGDERFYFKDGNILWLSNFKKELNSQFLYYWIDSSFGRDTLRNRTIGSAQPALTIDSIKKLSVPIPPIEIQEKIAFTLKKYDEILENNNKRIKLLEQMAENLYKEWFVRFRFPGYEDVEFENGLPKDWKIERLSDIADIIMGQSPKSENYNTNCEGLPFHQGVGSYGDFYLIDDIYSTKGNRIAEANSIIFSVRAPVGRINITLNKIILGRGVASINSVKGYNAYLLWMLKNQFQQEDIIGNGSIFASVTKKDLFGFKILMPNENLIQKFDSIASGIESVMRKISLINSNLEKQRDMLLPRLMSGKLEV